MQYNLNIAGGTADPGYCVYNLNYLFDCSEFVFIFQTYYPRSVVSLAMFIILKFRFAVLLKIRFVIYSNMNMNLITAMHCGSEQMAQVTNLATRWHHLHNQTA